MRRPIFGAEAVATLLIASGVAIASVQPSFAAEAGSALPTWLPGIVHAKAYVAPAAPFVPNEQTAGTPVPGQDVTARVGGKSELELGLATLPTSTQTYPAISTDGGMTWSIDGPLFHVDALQGASGVGSSGLLPPHGAFFWGRGGNIIWITYDEGAIWWMVALGGGVDGVSLRKGTLEAVALGAQVKHGTAVQRFLYVSTDSGKTWRVRRQLADLRI